MVFKLTEDLIFPPVEYSENEGLLAIGGDLSVERLLLAYSSGIFPWFNADDPILWWSPDPRPVFIPGEIYISKSLRQIIRRDMFRITFDTDFQQVLFHCANTPRRGQQGTWLTREMHDAYTELHRRGFCHSVEAWLDDRLVGGLYGVAIGRFFVGESMFHLEDNASKVAFFYLSELLKKWNFLLIDGQASSPHLFTLGAKEISRKKYLKIIDKAMEHPSKNFCWDKIDYQSV